MNSKQVIWSYINRFCKGSVSSMKQWAKLKISRYIADTKWYQMLSLALKVIADFVLRYYFLMDRVYFSIYIYWFSTLSNPDHDK